MKNWGKCSISMKVKIISGMCVCVCVCIYMDDGGREGAKGGKAILSNVTTLSFP